MTKIKGSAFLLIGAAALSGLYFFEKRRQEFQVEPKYDQEISQFRNLAEERLRSPDGWLTVVGLHWLKAGVQTLGSANTNNIILPKSAPEYFGSLELAGETVNLKLNHPPSVTIDGKPAPMSAATNGIPLTSDAVEGQNPTLVKVGSVKFFVIKRKNGIGLRVKDENSDARNSFSGRSWYPPKSNYVVDAEWVPFDPPKKVGVPDILGNLNEETAPGLARFRIEDESVELTPIQEGEKLFFIFRDQTSGKETYGAARFLYADTPVGGRVTLDFNKAVNPPCAFTAFATCPMPMNENIVKVAIRAGELNPDGH